MAACFTAIIRYADVAQSVERLLAMQEVAGSSPAVRSMYWAHHNGPKRKAA